MGNGCDLSSLGRSAARVSMIIKLVLRVITFILNREQDWNWIILCWNLGAKVKTLNNIGYCDAFKCYECIADEDSHFVF